MREYKFMAKSLYDGEWWKGYYIYSKKNNKHFIVQELGIPKEGFPITFNHFAEVDPETVSQSIGQPDSEGNDIYDCHVLEDKEYGWLRRIYWSKRDMCYEMEIWEPEANEWIYSDLYFTDLRDINGRLELTIVGTIHDQKFKEMFKEKL